MDALSRSPRPRQRRFGSSRSRKGCITCRFRHTKCDEGKPACHQCTSTGRRCDGYMPRPYSLSIARQLGQVTAMVAPAEARALEFFFRRSATHLAGYFGDSFWTGTVLQLSLTEPAIRNVVAAIGTLYEAKGSLSSPSPEHSPGESLALRLYNRAIRSTIETTPTVDARTLPLQIVIRILFAALEFFRQNASAASLHVINGLTLVRLYRQHGSSRASCVELELVPILMSFSSTTYERAALKHLAAPSREKVYFNPTDAHGRLVLPRRFSSPKESRVALLDAILYSINAFQDLEEITRQAPLISPALQNHVLWVAQMTQRWRVTFEDMVQRKQSTWSPADRNACDATRLLWYSVRLGTDRHRVGSECGWDTLRAHYETIVQIAERLLGDLQHFPDEISKTITLDTWLMYPLHVVAWKCRWPHLRRRALDLFRRIPKHEYIFYVPHYVAICSRIMDFEERSLGLNADTIPDEDWLPPDTARVYDFVVAPQSTTTDTHPLYSLTLMMLPEGPEGEPAFHTEPLWLPPSPAGPTITPFNVMKRRSWSQTGMRNQHVLDLVGGIWV